MVTLTLTAVFLVLGAQQDPAIQKPVAHRGTLLVEAKRIHVSSDRVIENSAILIRNGKVLYVGKEIPEDAKKTADKISFPNGTVIPGMINVHTNLGHGKDLEEKIDAFTPELSAAEGFDPFVPEVLRSAKAGITTAGLAPTSRNAFAGQGAAVHTGKIGKVIVESTYLKMSMLGAALIQDRFPTSRMGAADLIRRVFKQARSVIGPTDGRLKILNDVVTGSRRLAFHVGTEAEINSVLDLSKEIAIKPLLVGCEEGHKCIERIPTLTAGVVLAPLTFGSPEKRLSFPGELEKLGVKFSFMAERPEDLRISAALAVRHGATAKTVLAALTETAATHTDAASQVGTLFEGRSADFCVFSGDPLDLTSRILAVYISGVPVALDSAETKTEKVR